MKLYRIFNGFNYLYITGEGFPKWRDAEFATLFTSRDKAQFIIDCCGLDKSKMKIVAAR